MVSCRFSLKPIHWEFPQFWASSSRRGSHGSIHQIHRMPRIRSDHEPRNIRLKHHAYTVSIYIYISYMIYVLHIINHIYTYIYTYIYIYVFVSYVLKAYFFIQKETQLRGRGPSPPGFEPEEGSGDSVTPWEITHRHRWTKEGTAPGLVNIQKTDGKITILSMFNGKTHYFYDHVQ